MSFGENPYESPAHPGAQAPFKAELVNDGKLWRKGRLLVMDKSAQLPDRCVKSNAPTSRRLRRSLSWHHPAVFLAVLPGLLFYVIIALLVRQTANIQIGLSDEWFGKRRRAILIGWGAVLASVGMVIGGGAMVDSTDWGGLVILLGVVTFLVGAIYGLVAARMVTPERISKTHIWLKGVSPEFLKDLPEWPHTP